MKKYELVYIINPTLDEASRKTLQEKLHAILVDNGATITNVDEWGSRELAYEIQDFKRGYYSVVKFETEHSKAINEFNRLVRVNTDVLRFLIVLLD